LGLRDLGFRGLWTRFLRASERKLPSVDLGFRDLGARVLRVSGKHLLLWK
jgi:hypothetical protein